MPRAEADAALLADLLAAAERDLAEAPEDRRMAAGQRVRDASSSSRSSATSFGRGRRLPSKTALGQD